LGVLLKSLLKGLSDLFLGESSLRLVFKALDDLIEVVIEDHSARDGYGTALESFVDDSADLRICWLIDHSLQVWIYIVSFPPIHFNLELPLNHLLNLGIRL
jgi:hypothetical protein